MRPLFLATAAVASAALALASAAGCQSRARMCGAPNECGLGQGCVAGRCMPEAGTPALQNAKRLLLAPVDVAFLRRGDTATGGALPPIVALGRASDSEALLLLRFDVPMTKDVHVVEAYLLLERSSAVDSDPTPLTLHAARIIDPWNGRSISWALQPRIDETRSPSTTVDPAARALVRLDVRDLVQHWRRHEKTDQGIAVVADTTTETGMAFALTPVGETTDVDTEPGSPSGPVRARGGPRLELYIKDSSIKEPSMASDGGLDAADGESKRDAGVSR